MVQGKVVVGTMEEFQETLFKFQLDNVIFLANRPGMFAVSRSGIYNILQFAGSASGTTAERPYNLVVGFQYFDTTIGKPIWWNGSNWVDATGTAV